MKILLDEWLPKNLEINSLTLHITGIGNLFKFGNNT